MKLKSLVKKVEIWVFPDWYIHETHFACNEKLRHRGVKENQHCIFLQCLKNSQYKYTLSFFTELFTDIIHVKCRPNFSSLIFSKFVCNSSFIVLSYSFLVSVFFLLKILFHSSSSFSPLLPISLQEFIRSWGISKGPCFHLSFFLTNFISSSPRGAPWEDALPDLFGEPNPIMVLQDIIDGFFDWVHFIR